MLPQLDRCDAVKAANVRAKMDLVGVAAMPICSASTTADWIELYADVVSMLPCLGITCAELGGLVEAGGMYYPQFAKCRDVGGGTEVVDDYYTPCSVNEYVSSNVCTTCPAGTTRAAGDDASGADTACAATPSRGGSSSSSGITSGTILMAIGGAVAAGLLACVASCVRENNKRNRRLLEAEAEVESLRAGRGQEHGSVLELPPVVGNNRAHNQWMV